MYHKKSEKEKMLIMNDHHFLLWTISTFSVLSLYSLYYYEQSALKKYMDPHFITK